MRYCFPSYNTLCVITMLLHLVGKTATTSVKTRRKICPLHEHVICNQASNLAFVKNFGAGVDKDSSFSEEASQLRPTRSLQPTANAIIFDVTCTCAMTANEAPAEQPSCTHLLAPNNDKHLEAISVLLLIDAESENRAQFWEIPRSEGRSINLIGVMEGKFRSDLAATFNTNKQNIIVLRIRCSDDNVDVNGVIAELTNDGKTLPRQQYSGAFSRHRAPPSLLTVQFVVLKRNSAAHRHGPLAAPFSVDELVDAPLAANRVRTAYAQKALAGFRLLDVQAIYELIDVEAYTSNHSLIIQATIAAAFIVITSFCGCYIACRKRGEHSDDIRKP